MEQEGGRRVRATEKFRKLLDELGVRWTEPTYEYWELLGGIPTSHYVTIVGGKSVEEAIDGTLAAHHLTPEQAVAATVGNDDTSRWHELFGTPERAARTLANNCHRDGCIACPALDADCNVGDYDKLLEWLRGDA
jgi:hypothetical protein